MMIPPKRRESVGERERGRDLHILGLEIQGLTCDPPIISNIATGDTYPEVYIYISL